jgi:hypothetical protein
MCLFRFLSKNENNNGFGVICSAFLHSIINVWRIILYTAVFRIGFFGCFDLDCMRNLHNEHHLAAKSGTFSAFLR